MKATLLEHLKELRKRLIFSVIAMGIGTLVAFFYYPILINFLITPFIDSLGSKQNPLYVTTLFEGFITKFKLSIIVGIILSLPIHLYNFIRFSFPGLRTKERWIVGITLLSSSLLIALSFYLSYYKIIPFTISFMTTSGFIPFKIGTVLHFQKNIFYIVQLIFYALILFQLPILLELLLALNVLTRQQLLASSKYIIIGTFVICAVITPPDFISQISLAVPLIGLFYLSILIAKLCKFGEPKCSD